MGGQLRRAFDISLEWIEKVVKVVIGIVLAAMIVVNVMEVISRYIGGGSIFWVHELTLLLVSWLTFLGIGVVYRQKTDAAVEIFVNLFRGKVKKAVLLVVTPIVVGFLVIFIWRAFLYLSFQEYPTPALGIPTRLFSIPVIVGLVLIILCLVRDMFVRPQDLESPVAPSCEGSSIPEDPDLRHPSE